VLDSNPVERSMRRRIASHGWAHLSALFEVSSSFESDLVRLGELLGTTIPSVGGRSTVDHLRPSQSAAQSRHSLSEIYGLQPFPLHIDTAHWKTPCRYVLFACYKTGTSAAATHVMPWSRFRLRSSDRELLSQGIFLYRNGLNSFLGSVLTAKQPFPRIDLGCMEPMNRAAKHASARLTKILTTADPHEICWAAGDVLVIDNWACLHGRARVLDTSDRELLRLLVAA
jgi:hypothetical protein